MATTRGNKRKSVEALTHGEARRRNLPSAEHQPLMREEEQSPIQVAYERRNRDLDPQLVWRGKDEQDEAGLVVNAPPLYIQERVHPKALVDDLMRQSRNGHEPDEYQTDMFADFNGLPSEDARTEFYQHDANWSNRMVLGDSLQVMASLATREGLRGKVQCIYIDPPYGIKFNSNFQWSTTSRDVRDGNREHITREAEQVKAFRDTWQDGIHSYLTYLYDRLSVARDLLADSGSIFVQIGDENVHRVRAVMDEVLGEGNFVSLIQFRKTAYQSSDLLANTCDFILWYAKDARVCKVRHLWFQRPTEMIESGFNWFQYDIGRVSRKEEDGTGLSRRFQASNLTSQGSTETGSSPFNFQHYVFHLGGNQHWKTHTVGLDRLRRADRLFATGRTLTFKRFVDDYRVAPYKQHVDRHYPEYFRDSEHIHRADKHQGCAALCPHDHRPR